MPIENHGFSSVSAANSYNMLPCSEAGFEPDARKLGKKIQRVINTPNDGLLRELPTDYAQLPEHIIQNIAKCVLHGEQGVFSLAEMKNTCVRWREVIPLPDIPSLWSIWKNEPGQDPCETEMLYIVGFLMNQVKKNAIKRNFIWLGVTCLLFPGFLKAPRS